MLTFNNIGNSLKLIRPVIRLCKIWMGIGVKHERKIQLLRPVFTQENKHEIGPDRNKIETTHGLSVPTFCCSLNLWPYDKELKYFQLFSSSGVDKTRWKRVQSDAYFPEWKSAFILIWSKLGSVTEDHQWSRNIFSDCSSKEKFAEKILPWSGSDLSIQNVFTFIFLLSSQDALWTIIWEVWFVFPRVHGIAIISTVCHYRSNTIFC